MLWHLGQQLQQQLADRAAKQARAAHGIPRPRRSRSQDSISRGIAEGTERFQEPLGRAKLLMPLNVSMFLAQVPLHATAIFPSLMLLLATNQVKVLKQV